MTYKFIKGDAVKYQHNLGCKKELEAIGFKLEAEKEAPKEDKPSRGRPSKKKD